MSIQTSPAWHNLAKHRQKIRSVTMEQRFAKNAQRLQDYTIAYQGLRLNYAFQDIDDEGLDLLAALAEQQNVAGERARMFAGETINVTEKRPVLHTALRHMDDTPFPTSGFDVMPHIRATRERMATFVDRVRSGQWVGATGKPIHTIVNIGIGGSDLGPRMAALALKPYASGLDVRFVANVDSFDLECVLRGCDPAQTLFVVVSKTFKTQETLLNARSARQWLVADLGKAAVAHHFVAVSTDAAAVEAFGIDLTNMFPMWDWVGGRFSVWSAVGLSLALAVGNEHFRNFLDGAAALDAHFVRAPLPTNLPIMAALLGVWNRNFLAAPALAILPYAERLRELPRYLQQLEMESNGKSVTRSGEVVDYDTVPALFGECGTVGQHSFHQWLHQGTTILPADFIGVVEDDRGDAEHHQALMSNMAAQIGALAFGQKDALPHNVYAGGRPSNVILIDRLDPYHLGMLLAFYEHKSFVQGILWDINSFDQPGVELGKRMAHDLESPTQSSNEKGALMKALFKQMMLK